MDKVPASKQHPSRRVAARAFAPVLAAIVAGSIPTLSHADSVNPPAVPAEIQVPAGSKAFLIGHAVGTQNYVCLPAGAGFAWTLSTPQATLFDNGGRQIATHYFSPNPAESGTMRATWQHSSDTSTAWAQASPSSSDPAFVARGAIPWLLLRVVGTQPASSGGATLAASTYVHRVNTSGGAAPSTGCSGSDGIGNRAFVPYTADYVFYTDR
jgi:hypothetical protein